MPLCLPFTLNVSHICKWLLCRNIVCCQNVPCTIASLIAMWKLNWLITLYRALLWYFRDLDCNCPCDMHRSISSCTSHVLARTPLFSISNDCYLPCSLTYDKFSLSHSRHLLWNRSLMLPLEIMLLLICEFKMWWSNETQLPTNSVRRPFWKLMLQLLVCSFCCIILCLCWIW